MNSLVLDPELIEFDEAGIAEYWWPIALEEIDAVRAAFFPALPAAIREAKEYCRIGEQLQAIQYLVPEFTIPIYIGQALSRRASDQGREITPNPESTIESPIASGDVPNAKPIVDDVTRVGVGYKRFVPQYVRQVKWSLRWNGLDPRGYLPLRFYSGPVAINATNKLLAKRAKHASEPVMYVQERQILDSVSGSLPPKLSLSDADQRALEAVIQVIASAFEAGNETLPSHLRSYIREWLEEAMTTVRQYVDAVHSWQYLPETLWMSSGVTGKIIAMAVKRDGGEVALHDHAGGAQFLDPGQKAIIDYELPDTVVTYNESMASLLKEGVDTSLLVRESIPEIVSFSGRGPKQPTRAPERTIAHSSMDPLDEGSRIMYVAPHYRVDAEPYVPAVVMLDWQYRLLSALVELGYEPIFKPHPESTFTVTAPFEADLGIEVMTDSFEAVMDAADGLLFDNLASSTLPFALWSDKPILVVDFDLSYMTNENRSLLSERCAIVEGDVSDRNRLTVDRTQLKDALSKAHEHNGTTFIEQNLTTDTA